jgi:EpsD family peptidyl-prolyl cis-trans isomerase
MIVQKVAWAAATSIRTCVFARTDIARLKAQLNGFRLCCYLLLIALPQPGSADPQALSSRVLASVNGAPIAEADVELMLKRALKLGTVQEASATTRKKLLEDFIFMRLAEQAINEDDNVFKPGNVRQELEITRLQTLLNVYLDAKAASTNTPSLEELAAFVDSHPQFFKDRRTYYFTQIDIDRKKQIDLAAIKTYAQSAKQQFSEAQSSEEKNKAFSKLVGYVEAVAGKFFYTKGWKSTEEIDPFIFARLKQMKDGEVLVDEESNPERIRVLMLQASQPVPIDVDQATQVAAQMIRYNESRRAADLLYNQLRAQADVRYGKEAERAVAKSSASASSESVAYATSNAFFKSIRWKHLWTAWIFALIVLLPAALVHFHRRAVAQREMAYFVDEDFLSSILNRVKLFSLTPIFEIVFAVLALITSLGASWAIINAFSLFSNPIVFVTMALSGLVVGTLVWSIWSTYASRLPCVISESRWLPVVGVLLVQAVGILIAVAV